MDLITRLIMMMMCAGGLWIARAYGQTPAPTRASLVFADGFEQINREGITSAWSRSVAEAVAGHIARDHALVSTPWGRGIDLKKNGHVLYNQPVMLDPTEGTIELRLALNFTIDGKSGGLAELWRFTGHLEEREFMSRLYIIPASRQLLLQVYSVSERTTLLILRVPIDWRQGEYHVVRVTWRDKTAIHLDGRLRTVLPSDGLLTDVFPASAYDAETARLYVGPMQEKLRSRFTIDRLRIFDAQERFYHIDPASREKEQP